MSNTLSKPEDQTMEQEVKTPQVKGLIVDGKASTCPSLEIHISS